MTLEIDGKVVPGSRLETVRLVDAYLERSSTQARLSQLSAVDP